MSIAIWNHGGPGTDANQLIPMANASNNTGNTSQTSSDGAGISANDFLTLLVTEMQNQDPTADTDPNEYINQLVNVNSLEQLISINQTLSGAAGTSANGGVEKSPGAEERPPAPSANALRGPVLPALSVDAQTVAGNLGAPAGSTAADRIAHAWSARR